MHTDLSNCKKILRLEALKEKALSFFLLVAFISMIGIFTEDKKYYVISLILSLLSYFLLKRKTIFFLKEKDTIEN